MSPKPSVLMFGDINVDNIFMLSEFPEPGRDGYANHVEMSLGGVGCNSAAVLAGLGQPTKLLGAVGDDIWSEFVYGEIQKAGIDTEYVITKPGFKTGLIFIAVTPNGERTMLSHRGVNLTFNPEDLPEKIMDNVSLLALSGYLFLNSEQFDTAWRLLELAEQHHIPVSIDTGLDPVLIVPDTIRDVLKHISILITGSEEAQALTGCKNSQDQVDALLTLGVEQVAVKLGRDGAWLGWKDGIIREPAFQVDVLDTTSAGDAFSAGLIFGYLNEISPGGSLLLANALGGLATTVYGAARISRQDVLSFLQKVHQENTDYAGKKALLEVIQRLTES